VHLLHRQHVARLHPTIESLGPHMPRGMHNSPPCCPCTL
jgi:hypothetical protein